jgi:SNF2 family DNA or RNA helicase
LSEISRLTNRNAWLVLDSASELAGQYGETGAPFTICNYQQVFRDTLTIETARRDLIIIDEGQRIKNWECKPRRTLKDLKSPSALVLSGTPLQKRQGLMHQFQTDPDTPLSITTNAGATGLNLHATNTIINVDLPWNPAVLEQRNAQAHRIGQNHPVPTHLLVTEGTLQKIGFLSS